MKYSAKKSESLQQALYQSILRQQKAMEKAREIKLRLDKIQREVEALKKEQGL